MKKLQLKKFIIIDLLLLLNFLFCDHPSVCVYCVHQVWLILIWLTFYRTTEKRNSYITNSKLVNWKKTFILMKALGTPFSFSPIDAFAIQMHKIISMINGTSFCAQNQIYLGQRLHLLRRKKSTFEKYRSFILPAFRAYEFSTIIITVRTRLVFRIKFFYSIDFKPMRTKHFDKLRNAKLLFMIFCCCCFCFRNNSEWKDL